MCMHSEIVIGRESGNLSTFRSDDFPKRAQGIGTDFDGLFAGPCTGKVLGCQLGKLTDTLSTTRRHPHRRTARRPTSRKTPRPPGWGRRLPTLAVGAAAHPQLPLQLEEAVGEPASLIATVLS
eukprot:COSAG01_NODE_24755_length_767_cov_2.453593_1_plen_122_part_10